jgi:3-deoxy-manno-octulosonate cytidylyltransferase (CMP-KDO synthetase)
VNVVAIIPCRYGSKRFEGKPMAPILGKPVIQWVYERANKAEILSDVVVATDDERILNCVERFGGRALLTARTHRSGSDRAAEAAARLDLKNEDIVLNIQGDQPALPCQSLSEVVRPLMEASDLVMSTLARRIRDPGEVPDPNCVKCVFDQEGFALYFSRSPVPFNRDGLKHVDVFKHVGIYAFRKHFLDRFTSLPEGRLEAAERLEQLRALEYGFPIKVVETAYDSKAVDTPSDIEKLEAVLGKERGEKTMCKDVDSGPPQRAYGSPNPIVTGRRPPGL